MTYQQKMDTRSEQIDNFANQIFRMISEAEAEGFKVILQMKPSGGMIVDLRDGDGWARNEPVWFVNSEDVTL